MEQRLAVLFLALLTLGSWVLLNYFEGLHSSEGGDPNASPDYRLESFVQTQYDLEGHRSRVLKGEKLVHFEKDDRNFLTQPRMQIFSTDPTTWHDGIEPPPWHIRADAGETWHGSEQILLTGNVIVDRDFRPGEDRYTHLETERLWVFPDRDYAETDVFARLKTESAHVTGVGAQAWFDTGSVKVLNDVRSIFEPKTKRPTSKVTDTVNTPVEPTIP
jgi:LPS export ABC transporter protein LptC